MGCILEIAGNHSNLSGQKGTRSLNSNGNARKMGINMMKLMKLGILLLTFCLAGTSAQALNLGTAGNYNVFVFNDYSGSDSDVEGALAAGGNVTLQNYGVGGTLSADSGDVLVAGGDLTYTNGKINNGNAVVGGSASLSGIGVPNGVV
jgi:hypothetical protein